MSVVQLALNLRGVLDISFYSRMTVGAFEKYISSDINLKCLKNLKILKIFSQTQTGNKMKVLRSDNGKEYTSKDFCKYTKERGIIHEFSSP